MSLSSFSKSHVINYYYFYFYLFYGCKSIKKIYQENNFINGNDKRTGYLPKVLVLGQKLILGKPF